MAFSGARPIHIRDLEMITLIADRQGNLPAACQSIRLPGNGLFLVGEDLQQDMDAEPVTGVLHQAADRRSAVSAVADQCGGIPPHQDELEAQDPGLQLKRLDGGMFRLFCKEFAFCGRPLKEPLGRPGGRGNGGCGGKGDERGVSVCQWAVFR